MRLLERALAADLRAHRDLGAGQVDRADRDVDLALLDDLGDGHPVDEHVEHRLLDLVGVDALAHRQVALRVEVDREDAMPGLGEGDGEVEGGGRLGDAALLVGEGDDLGGPAPVLVGGLVADHARRALRRDRVGSGDPAGVGVGDDHVGVERRLDALDRDLGLGLRHGRDRVGLSVGSLGLLDRLLGASGSSTGTGSASAEGSSTGSSSSCGVNSISASSSGSEAIRLRRPPGRPRSFAPCQAAAFRG